VAKYKTAKPLLAAIQYWQCLVLSTAASCRTYQQYLWECKYCFLISPWVPESQ